MQLHLLNKLLQPQRFRSSTKTFQNVFEKKNADILLEHYPYNCAIDLWEGAQPPFGPTYNLSQNKLLALKK